MENGNGTRLLSRVQFALVFSFVVVYGGSELAAYMCKASMEEIGYFTLLLRKMLALFDPSYHPVPVTCIIQEALEVPMMIMVRVLFAYVCVLITTLAIIFLEWLVTKASHECSCLP